jgi:hypothetical protein
MTIIINGYWWIFVVINVNILVTIDCYFIMAIGGDFIGDYFINGY